ncbi:MoaD/ThiS family protein [Candidatus Woesearchaeota archaeon]|nr:MoaD/ThiS family protein [Candidatus Woesearchaeota archaeon]
MKAFIERENKLLELEAKTGKELLDSLQINPATVLLVKNNEVILPEEKLSETDEVKILSVVSGG